MRESPVKEDVTVNHPFATGFPVGNKEAWVARELGYL